MVAGRGDQLFGMGEVGAGSLAIALRQLEPGEFQMRVAFVEPHAGAGGDAHCLVEIAPGAVVLLGDPEIRRPRQQPARKLIDVPDRAQTVDRLVQVLLSLGEIAALVGLVGQKLGPAEREVVEGDVEQPVLYRSPSR